MMSCGALLASGQKAQLVVQTGHTQDVSTVSFSPDGRVLASSSMGGYDGGVKLWDVSTGQELRTLVGSKQVFSPDGKTLASMDLGFTSGVAGIKLWDWRTGQELKMIQTRPNILSHLAFSPKGEVLASTGSYPHTVLLWDALSGQQVRTLAGFTDAIHLVSFSPDGKVLASGSGNIIKLWDWRSGQLLREIQVQAGIAGIMSTSFAFSPSGEVIAGISDNGQAVSLWSVATGTELKKLRPAFSNSSNLWIRVGFIRNVAFSPDGKTLMASTSGSGGNRERAGEITLWDTATGRERLSIDAGGGIDSIAFAPDGKTLAGNIKNQPKIWSAATGKEVRTMEGHATQVSAVGISADGAVLASGNGDGTIRLWNVRQRQVQILQGHTTPVETVVFSPDAKTLASSDASQTLKIWDTLTGRVLKTLLLKDPDTQEQVEALVPAFYRPRNYELALAGGKLKIVQWENGVRIYGSDSVDPNKTLASLISLDEKEWVVVTPDGLFDASPGARKLMHYIVGLETIALEQMKDIYYVPGLLQHIVKGEQLPKVGLFDGQDLFPSIEYTPLKPKQTQLNVKLTNRGGGIGQVQVLFNGKELVADARPAGFDPNSASATIAIDLSKAAVKTGEENKIEIVARNASGSLSTRGTPGAEIVFLDDGKKQPGMPNIYVIVGGISDYTGDSLKLSFAAKDAEDFARAVELGAVKLLDGDRSRVHIRLLTSGGSPNVRFNSPDAKISTATKTDFTRAFAEFRNATTDDVFIVYLAGHGVSLNLNQNPAQSGGDTYLYLTQEATTTDKTLLAVENSRKAMAISSEELKDLMKQNKALKQVLILDTCAAGALSNSLVGKRDLPGDQIRAIERLKDNTGFFVLMGASADAVSYEASQYGQGLLTYSLLQGMKGARLRNDQFADVGLLFGYAQDAVPGMARNVGGVQRPLMLTPETSSSFDIGRFTAEEQRQIVLSSPKPLILRPTLLDEKLKHDSLNLTQLLKQELREAGFSGPARENAPPLVFVEADEMTDAITPSGLYSLEGDTLRVNVVLTRNEERLGKEISVTGKANEKTEVVKRLVAAIIEAAKRYSIDSAPRPRADLHDSGGHVREGFTWVNMW